MCAVWRGHRAVWRDRLEIAGGREGLRVVGQGHTAGLGAVGRLPARHNDGHDIEVRSIL